MPREQQDAEASLRKLGQRVRAGYAKQHPISDKSLETVRATVRADWELEQKAKAVQKLAAPSKSRDRKPEEPGLEP